MIWLHADLINSDFLLFLTLVGSTLLALLVGIAFHEACHAFMANALGDATPASQGRTTLNPLAHLDPAGTALMLFVGFGWGKPVQFNPYGLKLKPKTASLLVAAAGPLSNFVAAGVLAIPIKMGWVPYINPFGTLGGGLEGANEYIGLILTGTVYLSCILGIFNLLPLPPLDGFKVAIGVLPDDIAAEFAKLDRYGIGPLMLLIFVLPFFGYNPLGDVLQPTVRWLVHLFTGVS